MHIQIKTGTRFLLAAVFFICLLINGKAQAAEKGILVDNNGVLNYVLNDVAQTDCYLAVKSVDGVNEIVKPLTSKSSIYYFDQTGPVLSIRERILSPFNIMGAAKFIMPKRENF